MNAERRYIHIRNWDRFQHPDTTRAKSSAIPWIKSYTGQLGDEDWVGLGWADVGLLEALRLQYATNRGRGINDSTANLQRLFGKRVLRVQLERLNDAGFIHFSASKTLATCKQPRLQHASPEEETEQEQEKDKPGAVPHLDHTPTETNGTAPANNIQETIQTQLAHAHATDDDIPF